MGSISDSDGGPNRGDQSLVSPEGMYCVRFSCLFLLCLSKPQAVLMFFPHPQFPNSKYFYTHFIMMN